MKSITIHGLDDALEERIRSKAGEEGLSLNETIKQLLRKSLGLSERQPDCRHFDDLFGTWSQADLQEFNRATDDLGQIDSSYSKVPPKETA
jgi:plasmid stability protein